MTKTNANSRLRMLAVFVGACVLASLVVFGTTAQNYLELSMRGDQSRWDWDRLLWPSIWWYAWAVLAPVCFEFAWRTDTSKANWRRATLLLIAGCFAAYATHVLIEVAAMQLPAFKTIHETLLATVKHHLVISSYLSVAVYWSIVGSMFGAKAYVASQQRALDAARLESELAVARLEVLRLQLHPHFLFNTLHGVSALMYRDVAQADAVITRLGKLLRRALDRSDVHEVSLSEEVDFLNEYLAIEQVRFGDRLTVSQEIEDGLEDALVPTFVFQPLVENAIKHGVGPSGQGGSILVRAWNDQYLFLEVADDGPGMEPGKDAVTSGVGLSNLSDRLRQFYGADFELHFLVTPGGGLTVRVRLPLTRPSDHN